MIPEIRKQLNAEQTDAKYQSFIHELNTTYKYPTDFRTAETPIFLTKDVKRQLMEACDEIVAQLQTPEFTKHASTAIPDGLSVPNESSHPTFLQIDFGICKDSQGNFIPQLIELQGFPSLYGYQAFLNDTIRKHFPIPPTYGASFNGFVRQSYEHLLRDVIVAGSDPKNVVLLEIEPEQQKTRIDFAVMEKMLGIKVLCLTKVKKRGNKLFYSENGIDIPIERIYNRVIFDELERKKIRSEFNLFDDVDVHWVGHPNWYFRISKHTLPFLKSRYVPDCRFLSDVKEYPSDLQNYVMKPLYSFAGLGVDIDVTKEKLDAVKDRSNYLLQKKVEYADLIETPDGFSKAEVRMMFVWQEKPVLVKNLVRLSKGRMMGVDFNKNKTWVGSTIAYHEPL
ncbi:MAG: hypothetical protein ACOYNS_02320 [Bacteroidota bacterium]